MSYEGLLQEMVLAYGRYTLNSLFVLPKIRERTISRKHNMGEISNMLRVIQ
jgi:hypothetical protein